MPGVSDARFEAAGALRALAHAFNAREVGDEVLERVARAARDLIGELELGPRRERVIPSFDELTSQPRDAAGPRPQGMADRAVVGAANPVSVEVETSLDGDVAVTKVVFGPAFEGDSGRRATASTDWPNGSFRPFSTRRANGTSRRSKARAALGLVGMRPSLRAYAHQMSAPGAFTYRASSTSKPASSSAVASDETRYRRRWPITRSNAL